MRRRATLRRRRELQAVVAAHERAGDIAREGHLHEDAVLHYQNALDVEAIAPADRSRVSEKLAHALLFGGTPEKASSLFDRVLATYLGKPAEAAKAIEILLQKSRLFWLNAEVEDSLAMDRHAIQIAEASGDLILRMRANLRMASSLQSLARFEEAEHFRGAAGQISDKNDTATQSLYYMQLAISAAQFGNAAEAYEHFDRAVQAAQESPDEYRLPHVWNRYAFWTATLGNTELAKSSFERALFTARQRHIVWYIPFACLAYAHFLYRMGQYGSAYEYLRSALSYEVSTPTVEEAFAEVGIPLALYFKDEAILAKCAKPSVIDFVFRTQQPACIGPAAAEFARWYVTRGREHDAEVLLHRAITAVHYVNEIWDLPIAVAQYGAFSDIPKARGFITTRAALPCSEVAQACLSLFDAFVSKRKGQNQQVHRHARNAAEAFHLIGWHGYADFANTLLPAEIQSTRTSINEQPVLADLAHVLTTREQQIAALVLEGLTSRAIADRLSISPHTVDSHVNSIMNRLGIRSRHQFAYVLTKP